MLKTLIDINQERQTQCAIIYLKSHEDVQLTLDKLCTSPIRDKLGFKFEKLVRPKEELGVEKLKFYRLGENIGLKNSTREFRSGTGNYIEKKLKRDVIKYICGFFNCTGQGRFYIRVNKTGHVVDFNCDCRTVHHIQNITDDVFKSVLPVLQPNCFTLKFIPVYYKNGHPKIGCKVVEIGVQNAQTSCLYSIYEEVYIRRETSVEGPLSVSQILFFSTEIHRKETTEQIERVVKEMQREHQIKAEQEKTELLSKMRQNLKEEKEKLEREREKELTMLQKAVTDLNKVKLKSKVCIIM